MDKQLAYTCLVNALMFCVVAGEAVADLTAIAVFDQNLPEGDGKFNVMNLPVINNAGQVAFHSTLRMTSAGTTSDNGLYLYTGASLAKVARENEAPPDGNGLYDSMTAYRLDASGQLAFFSSLKSTTLAGADDSALYRYSAPGFVKLVREGETEPNNNGQFSEVSIGAFNSGRMAFTHALHNTAGGLTDDSALFLHDGAALAKVVRDDETVPNTNAKFSTLFQPVINAGGSIAFSASLKNTSGGAIDNSAIYITGGGLTEVVRENAQIPGGTARYSGFFSPSLNNSNHVAFLAALRETAGGTTDDFGVFVWNQSSGITTVARENDLVPEGDGRFSDFGDNPTLQHGISVGGGGRVVFHGYIRGAASGVEEDGIYLFNGSSLTKIAREGDTVPGGDGKFTGFGTPVINASGHVAFRANLSDTADSITNQGLYLYDGSGLVQVARKNDLIDGVRLGGSPFLNDSSGCQDGLACGLNDSDQIAFQASVLGGGSGIFLYTPGVTPIALPGDYNNDKKVNAADYTVWRNNNGADITLPNDTTPGQVRPEDYGVWKLHYGESIPGSGAADAMSVPEPAGVGLICIGLLIVFAPRGTKTLHSRRNLVK